MTEQYDIPHVDDLYVDEDNNDLLSHAVDFVVDGIMKNARDKIIAAREKHMNDYAYDDEIITAKLFSYGDQNTPTHVKINKYTKDCKFVESPYSLSSFVKPGYECSEYEYFKLSSIINNTSKYDSEYSPVIDKLRTIFQPLGYNISVSSSSSYYGKIEVYWENPHYRH